MRLIDADEFKEIIVAYGKAGFAALRINKICELIDSQTTAYDADKVVERLKEKSFVLGDRIGVSDVKIIMSEKADEIVKSGGIE